MSRSAWTPRRTVKGEWGKHLKPWQKKYFWHRVRQGWRALKKQRRE
jgi:hypothetical protein